MNCYNCGAGLNQGDTCPECGANVKVYKKIIMASNAHYNEALNKVAVRDLSGAMESLNASLRFSKTNTNARNLLGLIHYEMGEIVEALTEWVLSKNYQPNDNIASRYIEEIQNDQARLASVNQTIKKYNQALNYCHQDSRDLAIIQLKKVLSLNPKLVRGHQLLALLYIQEGRYDLAKKSLRNAGKIDANNTITLRYLKEANAGIRENNPNKKNKSENEDLVSYQSGNETIIQPRYLNENSAFTTIINIFIGLIIGVAASYFLLIPGVRHQIQESSKSEVLEANNSIASKNQQISSLEAQIDDLTAQITDAVENDEQNESRLSSYEQLLLAYAAYQEGDIESAGTALGNVNPDYIEGDTKTIYDTVNSEVNAEYLRTMYREGTAAYSAQTYDTAIADLTKVVELDETYENGNALYYLAQSLRRNENLAEAKVYYQKFVELYPGTERAANAQNYISIEEE